jgi:hypothetical protein
MFVASAVDELPPESPEETLLFVRGDAIIQRYLTNITGSALIPDKNFIRVTNASFQFIAFDCQQERIIWSNEKGLCIALKKFACYKIIREASQKLR